jgi:hypothetical protein
VGPFLSDRTEETRNAKRKDIHSMKATSRTIPIDGAQHQSGTNGEIEETLRARAYELYEQRGRADGHDLQDWLQAKAEAGAANTRAESASA